MDGRMQRRAKDRARKEASGKTRPKRQGTARLNTKQKARKGKGKIKQSKARGKER
jgi:hypothetical protein